MLLACCCYFRAQGSGKGKCCRYRKPSLTRGREPVVNSWLYICNTEALLTILQQIFVRNEPSFTTQHCTRPTNISKCMAPTKRMIREYSPNLWQKKKHVRQRRVLGLAHNKTYQMLGTTSFLVWRNSQQFWETILTNCCYDSNLAGKSTQEHITECLHDLGVKLAGLMPKWFGTRLGFYTVRFASFNQFTPLLTLMMSSISGMSPWLFPLALSDILMKVNVGVENEQTCQQISKRSTGNGQLTSGFI